VVIELQHTLFYISLGEKLYLAPLGPNVYNVLDIATGITFLYPGSTTRTLILDQGLVLGQLNSVSHQYLIRYFE
jgi:hypothetical protein